MGKVEDAPAPHRIPLLVHAWNHLVIQPSQQCFEFRAQGRLLGGGLPRTEGHAQYLVGLLA
ncbi:hypothetical protein D3C77_787730 [compost metagenome]